MKYVFFLNFCFVLFLFVPPADSKGLSNPSEVEALREKVYASLEAYCKHKYPEQPGRYGAKWNRARPQTLAFREKSATHTHTHLERQSEACGGLVCVYLEDPVRKRRACKISNRFQPRQIKKKKRCCVSAASFLFGFVSASFTPPHCTYRFHSILMRETGGVG